MAVNVRNAVRTPAVRGPNSGTRAVQVKPPFPQSASRRCLVISRCFGVLLSTEGGMQSIGLQERERESTLNNTTVLHTYFFTILIERLFQNRHTNIQRHSCRAPAPLPHTHSPRPRSIPRAAAEPLVTLLG